MILTTEIYFTNRLSIKMICAQNYGYISNSGVQLSKVSTIMEPTTEPWGQRTCYIADPEGNLIEIGSFKEA